MKFVLICKTICIEMKFEKYDDKIQNKLRENMFGKMLCENLGLRIIVIFTLKKQQINKSYFSRITYYAFSRSFTPNEFI